MAQRLGNVAVGGIVKLKESGTPQEYIVVHQGKPSAMYDDSCNGTWLLKKDAWRKYAWDDDQKSEYLNSNFVKSLDEFVSLLDPSIEPFIKTVKIPYCVGGYGGDQIISGPNGNPCRVFPLGLYEIGLHKGYYSSIPADGSKLSYFDYGNGSSEKDKRIAEFNGDRISWWTRSPDPSLPKRAWYIGSDGDYSKTFTTVDYFYVRPAMIMQKSILVDDKGNILPTTYPEPPTSITVPVDAVPTGSTISVSWTVVTGATYKLQRSVDGGSWADIYTGGNTSYNDTAGVWNKVKYRVASVKSGITSGYTESKEVQILPYKVDKITAPSQVMEGQQVPVSWSTVAAANTYVLERKSSAADWAQIYSGADTHFTDSSESGWTSVQYRVKAGKDGTFGGYTTSPEIPVISASALVISGQDGDLGTLTNDVPYTVSSDTGNPITVERFVNGSLVARVTVESGFAYSIPVMELPTGAGTIKLVCSVTPSSGGPVTATRIWGYTKTVVQFPGEGGPAVLQQEGKKVLPITLAECIKVPVNWGGSLDKSLELLLPLLNTAVMATGSYTGTGTFGQDNPNELSFTFDPEIVIVSGASGSITISNKEPSGGQSDGYIQNQKATWYSTSAAKQLNVQREQYSYWAVGKAVQT